MRQNRETQRENDEKRAQGKHAKHADMRGCRTGVDSKLSRFRFGRVSLPLESREERPLEL